MPPLAVLVAAGLLADRLLGEPRRWHPLVGFGRLADRLETAMRCGAPGHAIGNRLRGLIAWCLLVLPSVALAWWLARMSFGWVLDLLLLWFALGGRSLAEHGQAVAEPLAKGDLPSSRAAVGRIVSRDTSELDETGVAAAAVESVLENGADAIFAVLFWFALLGGPGALGYRLANTLDGMWGYRDERRRYFGWAAARIDDLLNFVPARLTALSYAALGRAGPALACWRRQAPAWSSPNAGPVMAAGAGSLGLRLGGPAIYHGRIEERPALGEGRQPAAIDIARALALVRRATWLWLAFFVAWSLLYA